ncbi:MAG: L-histidine N(alpha)-methyltransferase [Actinomycetota bacterium]
MTVPQGGPLVSGLISHLGPDDLARQLRTDALEGLTSHPKSIPSKWFYDETGSRLFDEITRLPEYYLTRAERSILEERADSIARHSGADTLVELGSGTSEKSRLVIDAFCRTGQLRRFVPFDVDPDTLHHACGSLLSCYPQIEVAGIAGDFERHLSAIAQPGRTTVVFLGSTIGNLNPIDRAALLSQLSESLKPGDSFLLGVDLVKDVPVIEAAYNDSAGVSAAFNLNILEVLNQRLGGDFDPSLFEHVAVWDPEEETMRMSLRSRRAQSVRLDQIGLVVDFEPGEQLHTEISSKFRREGIEAELQEAGFRPTSWWTDGGNRFGLTLSHLA